MSTRKKIIVIVIVVVVVVVLGTSIDRPSGCGAPAYLTVPCRPPRAYPFSRPRIRTPGHRAVLCPPRPFHRSPCILRFQHLPFDRAVGSFVYVFRESAARPTPWRELESLRTDAETESLNCGMIADSDPY